MGTVHDDDPVDLPLRHGGLHGRDQRRVCAVHRPHHDHSRQPRRVVHDILQVKPRRYCLVIHNLAACQLHLDEHPHLWLFVPRVSPGCTGLLRRGLRDSRAGILPVCHVPRSILA